MTLKEFSLLKFLAQNRGRVFSRDKLLGVVWEYHEFRDSRTVDVHVRRIRMKLGPEAEGYIQTIVGAGYLFKAQSNAVESTSSEPDSGPQGELPAEDDSAVSDHH